MNGGPFAMPIHVRIKSYNRPKHLSNLLMDLHRQSNKLDVRLELRVFDDASGTPMAEPRAIVNEAGWRWYCVDQNFGKEGAWAFHNAMYESLLGVTDDAFIYFFDDDMRLCESFFGKSLSMWARIHAEDKTTLHLMVDDSRQHTSCWTGVHPKRVCPDILRTQWVDGSFLCQRSMLEAIDFALDEIGSRRWKKDPDRSTGVGQQLSHRLHAGKRGMYQTYQSLLVHASAESHYNPAARQSNPLKTVRFVDGKAAAQRLMRAEEIECSMATFPGRASTLKQVVDLVYDQVDVLRIYLNGYTEVPEYLCGRARLQPVLAGDEDGDLGDRGKFYWCDEATGYQLTIDDDIHYPANYADRIIAAIERYGRRALVGVHAITFRDLDVDDVASYYRSRNVTHFSLKLDRDQAVHMVGTGTSGYHADALAFRFQDFPEPNMADIWVARQAQLQSVPVVGIARRANWLRPLPTDGSIFDDAVKNDGVQTQAVKELWPWHLNKTSQQVGHHHERCDGDGAPGACRCRLWRKTGVAYSRSVRRYVNGMRQHRRPKGSS